MKFPQSSHRGRPAHLNPRQTRFIEDCVNPLLDQALIMKRHSISRTTLHRYLLELNLPIVKVGLGLIKEPSTKITSLNNLTHTSEKIDLAILQMLARKIQFRPKVYIGSIRQTLERLRRKEVDIALASLSWTPNRAAKLYPSIPYVTISPQGQWLGSRVPLFARKKPTLPSVGVLEGSIHHEYLQRTGPIENICAYKDLLTLERRLIEGSVESVFCHSSAAAQIRFSHEQFEFTSPHHVFDSYTAIWAHADSLDWLKPINQGLEDLHNDGIIARMQNALFQPVDQHWYAPPEVTASRLELA